MTLDKLLEKARRTSWDRFGKEITFYLPGMFVCNNCRGKYPAISITGSACDLMCEHCRGELLKTMIPAETPEELIGTCIELEEKGNHGVLISGGCDREGRLPWDRFLSAIREIRNQTQLTISVHSGLVDVNVAKALKSAGVGQALIDVIGDDRTLREIYHIDSGIDRIAASLDALDAAGLAVIPHIVCGLHYGEILGEQRAAEMIAPFDVPLVVIVSLMKNPAVTGWTFGFPHADDIAQVIARTRLTVPQAEISLGCARPRGDETLEVLAVDAGVNRMALPSEAAVSRARKYDLDIRYQKTCCSVFGTFGDSGWLQDAEPSDQ